MLKPSYIVIWAIWGILSSAKSLHSSAFQNYGVGGIETQHIDIATNRLNRSMGQFIENSCACIFNDKPIFDQILRKESLWWKFQNLSSKVTFVHFCYHFFFKEHKRGIEVGSHVMELFLRNTFLCVITSLTIFCAMQ